MARPEVDTSPRLPDRASDILVLQTAFLGDLILTLPLIDAVRRRWPDARIHALVNASAAPLLHGHADIATLIPYAKKGAEKGMAGLLRTVQRVRSLHCDLALVPHRSFRSGLIAALAGIPVRVGFSGTSAAPLLNRRTPRDLERHEGARNLGLLGRTALDEDHRPDFRAPEGAVREVDRWLELSGAREGALALAPGSVWETKRWPEASWKRLATQLAEAGHSVITVGGPEDAELGRKVSTAAAARGRNAAGELSIPGSLELIRRCRLLITNDTAPLHMGVAVRTPVLAIFGPTVPQFGFAPTREHDRVVRLDISCSPCAIHGGDRCPLGHHHCMRWLAPERLRDRALAMLDGDSAAESAS